MVIAMVIIALEVGGKVIINNVARVEPHLFL